MLLIGGADPQIRAGPPGPAFRSGNQAVASALQADEGVVPRGDPRSRGTAPPSALFGLEFGLDKIEFWSWRHSTTTFPSPTSSTIATVICPPLISSPYH